MHPNLLFVSALLAAAAPLAAQTAVSLPDYADAAEGHYTVELPFGLPHFRTQLLLDAAAIAPNGAVVSGLRFRADRSYVPLTAASVPNVTVSISQTSVAMGGISTTFASNLTQTPTVVFQGTVNLPGYTSSGAGPMPWDIVIPFTTPWQMTTSAGNVLVEITGNNALGSQPNYYLDSIPAGGAATEFGQAGNYANDVLRLDVGYGSNALVFDTRDISPGKTIRFTSSLTSTNPPGVLALGVAPQPVPIDLGPLGAPSHTLYVDPILLVPHTWQPLFGTWYSTFPLAVPNNPALVGTLLYGQSALFDATANALGLVLSSAVEVRIGDAVAEPPLQQIDATDPAATIGMPTRGIDLPEGGGTPVRLEGIFF